MIVVQDKCIFLLKLIILKILFQLQRSTMADVLLNVETGSSSVKIARHSPPVHEVPSAECNENSTDCTSVTTDKSNSPECVDKGIA